jgi:hypothetical protein
MRSPRITNILLLAECLRFSLLDPNFSCDAMVLGILTAIAACPAIIGTTEAVRQGQRKSAKEQHRGVKSNLIVSCCSSSTITSQINRGIVVLRNQKVWRLSLLQTEPERTQN